MTDAERGTGASRFERMLQQLVLAGLRLLNPVMKRVLASPLHPLFSRWFALLSFTGHKSGRRISTPASYVRQEGVLLLTTKRPWWRSLEAAGAVEATVAGRRANWSVEIVRGEDAIAQALVATPGWFLVLAALDDGRIGRPDVVSLRWSARQGRVVLRLTQTGNSGSGGTRGAPSES